NSFCELNFKTRDWHQVVDVLKEESKISLKAPISAYLEEKKLVSNFSLYQEVRVEIEGDSLESVIIQKSISSNLIKQKLLELSKKLKEEEIVKIYTDGAMVVNSKRENKIGIGWIVKLEDRLAKEISFSSSIGNWPSSTRAELGAIWTALLTTPVKAQVHIYTDSKAAIEAIKKYRDDNKLRNWFKAKNRSLLKQIQECCRAKNLDLK